MSHYKNDGSREKWIISEGGNRIIFMLTYVSVIMKAIPNENDIELEGVM